MALVQYAGGVVPNVLPVCTLFEERAASIVQPRMNCLLRTATESRSEALFALALSHPAAQAGLTKITVERTFQSCFERGDIGMLRLLINSPIAQKISPDVLRDAIQWGEKIPDPVLARELLDHPNLDVDDYLLQAVRRGFGKHFCDFVNHPASLRVTVRAKEQALLIAVRTVFRPTAELVSYLLDGAQLSEKAKAQALRKAAYWGNSYMVSHLLSASPNMSLTDRVIAAKAAHESGYRGISRDILASVDMAFLARVPFSSRAASYVKSFFATVKPWDLYADTVKPRVLEKIKDAYSQVEKVDAAYKALKKWTGRNTCSFDKTRVYCCLEENFKTKVIPPERISKLFFRLVQDGRADDLHVFTHPNFPQLLAPETLARSLLYAARKRDYSTTESLLKTPAACSALKLEQKETLLHELLKPHHWGINTQIINLLFRAIVYPPEAYERAEQAIKTYQWPRWMAGKQVG
jgi:hypothetical protein